MYLELNRTWTGLTQDREYSNVDAVPPIAGSDWGAIGQTPGVADDYFVRTKDQKLSHVDIEHKFGPAHIRKFNAADFSGVPNGPPSRHAYWILKSLKNQFDTINDFAGRTVIEFAWPEDITP
jgi:hypothetical protein